MRIPFVKMNGTGNDFLIFDGRNGLLDGFPRPGFVKKVCRRRESIGADGVIIIGNSRKADFSWDFYNADGSVAEMCGNGARCAARFARKKRIAGKSMSFETLAGVIWADVTGSRVKVRLTDPSDFVKEGSLVDRGEKFSFSFINTGVPHVVLISDSLNSVDVNALGRRIRKHRRFSPKGTNVDFISVKDRVVRVRTYERGVEGETLACGTGVVAAAVVACHKGLAESPIELLVQSGDHLTVHLDLDPAGARDVFLEGETSLVCEGYIRDEALK